MSEHGDSRDAPPWARPSDGSSPDPLQRGASSSTTPTLSHAEACARREEWCRNNIKWRYDEKAPSSNPWPDPAHGGIGRGIAGSQSLPPRDVMITRDRDEERRTTIRSPRSLDRGGPSWGRTRLNQRGRAEFVRRVDREEFHRAKQRNLDGDWIEKERLARDIKRNIFSSPRKCTPPRSADASSSDDEVELERACLNLEEAINRIPTSKGGTRRGDRRNQQVSLQKAGREIPSDARLETCLDTPGGPSLNLSGFGFPGPQPWGDWISYSPRRNQARGLACTQASESASSTPAYQILCQCGAAEGDGQRSREEQGV